MALSYGVGTMHRLVLVARLADAKEMRRREQEVSVVRFGSVLGGRSRRGPHVAEVGTTNNIVDD